MLITMVMLTMSVLIPRVLNANISNYWYWQFVPTKP